METLQEKELSFLNKRENQDKIGYLLSLSVSLIIMDSELEQIMDCRLYL